MMKYRNHLNCIRFSDKIGCIRKATKQDTPRVPINRRIDIQMIDDSIERRIEF